MQYRLSQVLGVIKTTFDEFFGDFQFWCTAEVMACKTVGKNTYLQLVEYEENDSGKTTVVLAKSNGNIFQPGLIEKFFAETGLDHTTIVGQKILFQGRVSYHKDYGVSVLINLMSSNYTLGLAQKNKHTILQTLKDELLADKNRNLALTRTPLSIAIISGETSAGLEDFLHILQDAGIVYTYELFQAVVQGNSAKEDVYAQLEIISHSIRAQGKEIDIVCVVRGGGESGGIAWQNDIDIARSICKMPVPVMIAIGHTQDRSVLESIVWKFAKTPSEAAFYILQHYNILLIDIEKIYGGIVDYTENTIKSYTQRVQDHYTQIIHIIPRLFAQYYDRIQNLYTNILAYHPQGILQRGYAIVRDAESGQILGEETPVPGKRITIQTDTYNIVATIYSIVTKK